MKPKTAIEVFREARTRGEAIRRYALAHDHFAELEQLLVNEGRVPEAEGAHQYALLALRAYRAELDDPKPE